MAKTLENLLRSKGISMADQRHKHYKPDWVHICCPFCADRGHHLGFPEGSYGGRCFKCGKRNLAAVLRILFKCSFAEAKGFADQVCKGAKPRKKEEEEETESGPLREVELPPFSGFTSANERHLKYLLGRGFVPSYLEATWDISYTRLTSPIPWAIIIPVRDEAGRRVSWQARDITGKAEAKYKTCPATDIKKILYGLDKVPRIQDSIIVVEGVTDVWRLGAGEAVATFGMDWSKTQLKILSRRFKKILVLHDKEDAAKKKAGELCEALRALGKTCQASFCKKADDPGSLDDDQAAEVVKDVKKWFEMN